MLSTDHKPLLAILNGKSLEEITNQRILRLRRKTDCWNTKKCKKIQALRQYITKGFPEMKSDMPDQTVHFWTVRKTLRTKGDLIM